MNIKKIFKRLLIITTIILIVLLVKNVHSSEAADTKIKYVTMAHWGYEKVAAMSYDDIHKYVAHDDNANDWQGCHQVMCLHNSDTNSSEKEKAYMIIDINPDGTNPKAGTVIVNGGSPIELPESNYNAMLAYIAAFAEDRADSSGAVYNTVKNPFSYFWTKTYKDYLDDYISASLIPVQDNASELNWCKNCSLITAAKNYAKKCTTMEETCSARILVFAGGFGQTRAILYGTKATITPEIEMDKHITKVIYENGTSSKFNRTGRKTSAKYRSPVTAKSSRGAIDVYYTINIKNVGDKTITGTYEDTYDTIFTTPEGVVNELKKDITLKPGEEATIDIVLRLPTWVEGVKYENEAKFTYGDDEAYASDYIRVGKTTTPDVSGDVSGNYKKYITAINGNPVEDRSGYDNETAKNNPITVNKGDVVTYKLEITAQDLQGNYDYINYVILKDIMEDGITPNGDYSKINTGKLMPGETYTTTVTGTVTKSQMYLLPLENTMEIVRGKYTYTTKEDCGDEECTSCPHEVEHTDGIDTSWFTSNANKDYVQLDDVEIAGDVWLDSNKDGIKSSETAMPNINVILNLNGNDIRTTTTDSNGHYSFDNVVKGDTAFEGNGSRKYADNSGYNNYYVRFEYFGVNYESTIYTDGTGVTDSGMPTNWENQSHASEANVSPTNRQDFNNGFETIAYNVAYAGTTGSESSKNLVYNKNGHTSGLTWTPETTIAAKSLNLFIKVAGGDTGCADDVEYLKHINLGLIRRETADLETTKDVVKADVTVNGNKTTYKYEGLGSGNYTVADYNKISTPYTLRIYNEDYEFRTSNLGTELAAIKEKENPYTEYGNDNDLNIILTYKVTIKNNSADTKDAVVREILDYSTNEMVLKEARMGSITGPQLTTSTTSNYNKENKYTYTGYNNTFITGNDLNVTLGKGESLDVYLIYKVQKDSAGYIIKDAASGDTGKINIAEVAAFSIYNAGTKTPSGLVDVDSNPANINTDIVSDITNTTLYEDDTFQTSILMLLRTDPPTPPPPGEEPEYEKLRQISGNVWEDLNTETLDSEQMVGDGIKKGSETGVGSNKVRVKLMEIVRDSSTNEEYLVDTGIETYTDENGDYTLEDEYKLHAGQYVVRFIYGSEASELETEDGNTIRYSGQDYKSTKYVSLGDEDEVIEANAFTNDAGSEVKSYAKDNELRRLEVIDYSTEMTYSLDNILKAMPDDAGIEEKVGTLETLAENTAMYADTMKFNTQIEYIENYENFTTKEIDGKIVYNYSIEDVDFGLIERPKTQLRLMNDITEIIAKTSDEKELVHLYFDVIYTKDEDTVAHTTVLDTAKSVGFENVQILNREYYTNQGFRYVNIDTDLLQGMTILMKFQIGIANNSDIDTSNENLINLVKDYKLSEVVEDLKGQTKSAGNKVYMYDNNGSSLSDLEKQMISSYSYVDLNKAVKTLDNNYKAQGVTDNTKYELGYFLGETYYTGTYNSGTDVKVETRVDQIINYVDTDLVFKTSENLNESGDVKFVSYSIEEIANKKLLRGIEEDSVITDGNAYYVVGKPGDEEYKNNLAFNIEDAEINGSIYKYLTALMPSENLSSGIEADRLYMIDIQATRTLASEADLYGVSLDNIAEIIKVSNTVGRKVYVTNEEVASDKMTGHIGNSTKKIDNVHTDIMLASKESDIDFTEYTTFSPPTGLSIVNITTEKTVDIIVVVVASIVVIMGSTYVTVKFAKRKRFYK